jgi:hypothetical protein
MEVALRAVCIGIGATVVFDLWARVLKRFFAMPAPNLGMLGRWLGHMPRGQFVHRNIAEASPVHGEVVIGRVAHYVIGIIFAASLIAVQGLDWARQPTLLPALAFGIITVVIPFFIMQPSLGAGVAASRTPDPNRARLQSMLGHTVFGVGLYLAALLSALFG